MHAHEDVRYHICGGQRLGGSVIIQGAKNAALPIIAVSLLATRGQTILHNVPLIDDVYVAIELATALGAKVQLHEEEHVLVIDATTLHTSNLPAYLTNKIRGSILFMPPVMLRTGKVVLETVGGCNLGKRNLDFHYRGFARLGAQITEEEHQMVMTLERARGTYLYLDMPSHTGTENLMAAACLAEGITTIENAALEPEIADVANFLNLMGAKITGVGTGVIQIEGVKELTAVEYTIMPDRIDAGAMVMLAAATQGDIALVGAQRKHLGVARAKLEQMGVELIEDGPVIHVKRSGQLRPVNIITWPYPGYATDLQPPMMTLACLARGTSYIRENLFEQRFSVAQELGKMGAKIEMHEGSAVVYGPTVFEGASVYAHDLRAGTALLIAGAVAEGETIIENAQMIERGHGAVIRRLSQLGMEIREERHIDQQLSQLKV